MPTSIARAQILALVFSVAVHLTGAGLAVLYRTESQTASHTAPIETLQVTFELIKSESQHEAEPVSKPEPVSKAEPVKKVKLIPLPKSKQPKPVKKKVARPRDEPEPEKKSVSKSTTKEASENIQRQRRLASSPDKAKEKTQARVAVSDSQKIDYYSLLQAHIEARKYYPRAARKLGIEGGVKVSFLLLKNGQVSKIQTSGAHRLLNHSASRAIKKSLPLPVPPDSMILPKKIHFSMHYDLKH